ncbi:MAG: FGGY family carbohydrate kinase, partial [Anaerovoracaceae bacterium]
MKNKKYYIGLDQGTTGTTTLLLDEGWNIVSRGYKEHKQYYPKPGWVEHDPLELWQRVIESMTMALNSADVSPEEVACIGIDNQGETVMLWDKVTGSPLYNAIVWQDRRMARYADELTKTHGELIRDKT